jgi:hypothetical protein
VARLSCAALARLLFKHCEMRELSSFKWGEVDPEDSLVMVRMPPKPPKAAPKPKTTKGEAQRRREIGSQTAAASSDDELDDTQIRFQEAHGSRLFRQGRPRALLEVKSPNIPTAIYEARLRGYDKPAAKKDISQVRKK